MFIGPFEKFISSTVAKIRSFFFNSYVQELLINLQNIYVNILRIILRIFTFHAYCNITIQLQICCKKIQILNCQYRFQKIQKIILYSQAQILLYFHFVEVANISKCQTVKTNIKKIISRTYSMTQLFSYYNYMKVLIFFQLSKSFSKIHISGVH